MKNNSDRVRKEAHCPMCGKTYRGYPALSRADNATLICPDCGTREALESIGVCQGAGAYSRYYSPRYGAKDCVSGFVVVV